MRSLQFQDTFKVLRIMKKAGLSKQARSFMLLAAESKEQLDVKSLGMDFIFTVLENMGDAEEEVYAFFADLESKSVDDIRKLDLDEMVGMFNDFLELPNLKGFFSKVFTLMK